MRRRALVGALWAAVDEVGHDVALPRHVALRALIGSLREQRQRSASASSSASSGGRRSAGVRRGKKPWLADSAPATSCPAARLIASVAMERPSQPRIIGHGSRP